MEQRPPATQLTFTPASREQSLAHLPVGTYTVAVSGRNRFKTSPGIGRDISIGVPSTPAQGVVVDILPGRVILTGPTPPHNSATYEWKYSFDGNEQQDFDDAIPLGRNNTVTITNTPHDGIAYVWYRLVDNDQVDPNWLSFSVANLIGLSSEQFDPAQFVHAMTPTIDLLKVDIDDLTDDLADIDNRFLNFSAETLDILKAEKLTREEGEALLLKSISENAAYQIELARKIEEGEELTNALVYRDAATGTIINRAYQFTEDKFTEAGLKIDGVQGEVNAAVKRIENTEDSVTNLSSELALLPGVITARATAIVSESIAALEPAHAFNFFDSAQGWQAVNGTLSAGVNEITVTHGDIENNTLSFDAADNKLIRVSLTRTAGTGWSGTVIIERDDNSIETYANYVEESALLLIDFTAMANYTGTITRVRLVLGESTADAFTITSITIGKADATTQDLANITARVNSAELQIDANTAEIAQRVTTSYFDNNAITVSNVEQTINALDVIIALEAKRQELIDNDVVQKSVSAAQFINGQTGTIQQIVSAFEQDLANAEGEISDVRQQIDGLGITQQAAALASQQIESYEAQAARLQLAVNDLDAFLKEADKNESFALAINQLQIDVSPEGSIAKDIESLQSATVSNGETITATNARLSQVETNANGNATAIEQLDLSVIGLGNSLTSAISRIDTVETTANNTASALSATEAKVNDPTSGNEALFNFAQQIKITSDANSDDVSDMQLALGLLSNAVYNGTSGLSATNTIAQQAKTTAETANNKANVTADALQVISNKVNNEQSGLGATNTIAQQAKTTAESADGKADANASAITSVNSTAQNANNKAQSALNLASTIDSELEDYRAIAQLAVDANGNAAFIQLGATPEISELIFQSMRVIFQNSQGVPRIFFDTEADDYVFNGLLRSNASQEIGENYMEISNPDGFGPDNLVYYRGPKFMSGSKPDLTKATKANADEWKDVNRGAYYGGTLSAGVLSNAGRASLLSLNPSLDVGPFNTNGNPKVIAFSFKLRADSTVDGACPTTSTTPSCTLKLQRKIGSGSWSTLQTKTLSGTVTKNYNAELEKCLIYEESEGSWTHTDTSTSTSTFSYRLVVSDQVRFHLTEDVEFQELSLISVEE